MYKNKFKLFYIFNLLAVIIAIMSFYLKLEFEKTKSNITTVYNSEHIQFVKEFTDNIDTIIHKKIDSNIRKELAQNLSLRNELEEYLSLFISSTYKYLYLLERVQGTNSNQFRFLLDGSKKFSDKSDFLENYEPLEVEEFNRVYKEKKTLFFEHKDIKSLWITYLHPIIMDEEVVAILVVDFSMKNYQIIADSLNDFHATFIQVILFSIFLILTILWFSFMDKKREDVKDRLFKKLEAESKKVFMLNATLEERVSQEVEKNREKDKQLIQQSRLAQMGEMISMIAHQWRQPLSAISATSSGMNLKVKRGTLKEEAILKYTDNITTYAKHLSKTIDDFRDFFKPTKEKVYTNYTEITESILTIMQSSLEEYKIELYLELECQDNFSTYANELKQVLLNLIKNAEDALVENKIENPYVKIKTYTEGTHYIMEVSDNGGGIKKEILENIFDPYFSTKEKRDGTGLGLYMSKTIINEHCEGDLSVRNREDGALFKITLS
jgi:C4-dicarboxylate-specific signal transduction histidine kinase